jgi:quinol-cytochrome oxidoreductase complex cytochrome b subunit
MSAPDVGLRVIDGSGDKSAPADHGPVTIPEPDHAAEWGDQPTIPFFPDHFLSEAVTMLLLLCLYTLLAVFMPATLENVANPLTTPAGIKPEWYFLFLYSFLHFVPPIVGIVVSMGGLVFLMALPFLDRNPSRKPRDRKVAIAMSFVVIAAIVGLSILGLME